MQDELTNHRIVATAEINNSVVTDDSTKEKGTLLFQHSPRFYFEWIADTSIFVNEPKEVM